VYKNKKILALITARGGSKRFPHKNIKRFAGKPLIAWTIEQARRSKYIDRIIVSTDSMKIAKIARKYRAEVPFLRPKRLSTDKAKSVDVVVHTIEWVERNNENYDLLILLQPTSPLRKAEDIDNAVRLLFQKRAKSVVSLCQAEARPWRCNTLPKSASMRNFLRPEIVHKNRRNLPRLYKLNGAIYLTYCNYFKRKRSFFGKDTYAYVMPNAKSVDIDSEADFRLAEILFRYGV